MTITFIGIFITAAAIYIDNLTQFKYNVFPTTAFAGVLTVVVSFVI